MSVADILARANKMVNEWHVPWKRERHRMQIIEMLLNEASEFKLSGHWADASIILQKALDISSPGAQQTFIMSDLVKCYTHLYDRVHAEYYAHSVVTAYLKENRNVEISHIFNMMGTMYEMLFDFERTIENFRLASIYAQKCGFYMMASIALEKSAQYDALYGDVYRAGQTFEQLSALSIRQCLGTGVVMRQLTRALICKACMGNTSNIQLYFQSCPCLADEEFVKELLKLFDENIGNDTRVTICKNLQNINNSDWIVGMLDKIKKIK